jgi:hypothetical protein
MKKEPWKLIQCQRIENKQRDNKKLSLSIHQVGKIFKWIALSLSEEIGKQESKHYWCVGTHTYGVNLTATIKCGIHFVFDQHFSFSQDCLTETLPYVHALQLYLNF